MRATLAVSLLLTAALPAAGQAPGPAASPWSVESPGSLGARFGLGFDLLLGGVDEAEVVAGRQTVRMIGEDGSPRTDIVPLDPGLVNRKHRQDWEERSFGFQVPVALPSFRLPGALQVEPSLVFEAAAVDGRLTFVDVVEGMPDRTLDGSGARWGVGVEALGELCRSCRWFWSAGYRYRSLGGLDLDGPAPADAASLAVTERTEIDHDAHHLTARLGALVAGGRATAYVGVRSQQSDFVIEDETTLRFPQARTDEIVAVATRLELDGDDTAALAGVDLRLGRRAVARVEASFGGDGESVLVKVVSFPGLWGGDGSPRPPRTADEQPSRRDAPEEVERQDRRADELADELAPRAEALRQRFHERARELQRDAGPRGALPAGGVRALLDDVEGELRQILDAPELRPTLAWFVDFAERSRRTLDQPPGNFSHHRSPSPRPTGSYRLAAFSPAPQLEEDRDPADPGPGILTAIHRFLGTLTARANSRELAQPLCVRSRPSDGAVVRLSAALPDSEGKTRITEGTWDVFYRGLYAYEARLGGRSIACPAGRDPADCDFLDFWDDDGPFVLCDFRDGLEVCVIDKGGGDACGGR